MKVHIDIDKDSDLIHSVAIMVVNVHDLHPAVELLDGFEKAVYGDADYQGIAKSSDTVRTAAEFQVAVRLGKRPTLPQIPEGRLQDLIQIAKVYPLVRVKHPFRVIKQQISSPKTT